MPRRNYIHKGAYKEQKKRLEENTKGFVDRLNKKMKKEAKRQQA